MGKGMILSDLNVHKEQNPSKSVFFSPLDIHELAGILRSYWDEEDEGPDLDLEKKARNELPKRTRDFGRAYQNVVLDLYKS